MKCGEREVAAGSPGASPGRALQLALFLKGSSSREWLYSRWGQGDGLGLGTSWESISLWLSAVKQAGCPDAQVGMGTQVRVGYAWHSRVFTDGPLSQHPPPSKPSPDLGLLTGARPANWGCTQDPSTPSYRWTL